MTGWADWRELRRSERWALAAAVVFGAALGSVAYVYLDMYRWFCSPEETAIVCRRVWLGMFGGWAAAVATIATVLYVARQVQDARRSSSFAQADHLAESAAAMRPIIRPVGHDHKVPKMYIYQYVEGALMVTRGEAQKISNEAFDYELGLVEKQSQWREIAEDSVSRAGAYLSGKENAELLIKLSNIDIAFMEFQRSHFEMVMPEGLSSLFDKETDEIDMRKIVDRYTRIGNARAQFIETVRRRISLILLESARLRREALDR